VSAVLRTLYDVTVLPYIVFYRMLLDNFTR